MPPSDARVRRFMLASEAWLLMPLFAVALRLASGTVLRRVRHRSTPSIEDRCELAGDVALAVQRAGTCLPARLTTCLPRACAAHVMLTRRGAASHLQIGVLKTPSGAVTAHAWVDAAGVEIGLDSTTPPFARLPLS
jgi:Transglutaminase-like superfamily